MKKTLNKIGDAIEAIVGTIKDSPQQHFRKPFQGQSNLERIGIESREKHLMQNEWKKDLQYTKLLVESEYDIQREFNV